jgi:hypothetical protein
MQPKQYLRPSENPEQVSVWREANGGFTIRDTFTRQQVELPEPLAEEIAKLIQQSLQNEGYAEQDAKLDREVRLARQLAVGVG